MTVRKLTPEETLRWQQDQGITPPDRAPVDTVQVSTYQPHAVTVPVVQSGPDAPTAVAVVVPGVPINVPPELRHLVNPDRLV